MSKASIFWTGTCLGMILQEVGHGLYLHNGDYAVATAVTLVVWGIILGAIEANL